MRHPIKPDYLETKMILDLRYQFKHSLRDISEIMGLHETIVRRTIIEVFPITQLEELF